MASPRSVAVLVFVCLLLLTEGEAATFTFVNRCSDTVWPGVLSNAGSPRLEPTGFELAPGAARAVPAPSGWSGRMWARTGCTQDGATGRLVCATGDCGSDTAGQLRQPGLPCSSPSSAQRRVQGTGELELGLSRRPSAAWTRTPALAPACSCPCLDFAWPRRGEDEGAEEAVGAAGWRKSSEAGSGVEELCATGACRRRRRSAPSDPAGEGYI